MAIDPVAMQRQLRLYEQLLDMGRIDDPEVLLRNGLEVAVEQVGATKGYLALFEAGAPVGEPPRWWAQVGCSGVERQAVEGELSRTIMRDVRESARAPGQGLLQAHQVVRILAAQGHPRYQGQHSVQFKNIKSVLAAPVGRVARGVLYLQDRAVGGVFGLEDERFLEKFVQHLGPFVDRVVLRETSSDGLDRELVGTSSEAQLLRATILRLAGGKDAPVCVEGPVGSGRTTVARAVHRHGLRARGPRIDQSCVAWPAGAAVDELFGVEGSVPALVGAAEGGTLILEDVDALSLDAQAALVAWLDSGAYRPRGGDAARQSSVRLVVTTRANLDQQAAVGSFHPGLLVRLQAGRVRVPALKERLQDVPALIDALGRQAATEAGLPWTELTAAAQAEALARPWSGNVAELVLALNRATVAVNGGRRLDVADLFPARVEGAGHSRESSGAGLFDPSRPLLSWRDWKHEAQGLYLRHALERNGGAREATWRALKLSRGQGYALLAEHELDVKPPSDAV